jgi:hypothetical protein
VSWDQRFFDPIVLSGRKLLVTLRDAAQYIAKQPKAKHDAKEWRVAAEALLLVAEHDGPTRFARIGDSESWRGIMTDIRKLSELRFSMASRRAKPGCP